MRTRSPFPGMDPWLEGQWGDLHHSIVQYSRDLIADQLPATLFAAVEESGAEPSGSNGGVAVAEPVRINVTEQPLPLGHIEIRRLDRDEPLVTAIEVVTPTNKLDARNRRQYVNKRDAYYAAGASVVEIDLLRTGQPLIDVPWERVPQHLLTPYRACIRRAPAGKCDLEIEYYPLSLRRRLPRIAIPLRATDADVILDLQQPIDQAYAKGRYGMRLHYAKTPPGPPLPPEDAEWVAEQLRQAQEG